MHFSEDDLRAALERKKPGAGFTQRVMARISQAEAEAKAAPVPQKGTAVFAGWWKLKPRPALAVAMAAILLAIGSWIGYQQYQQHIQKVQNQKQEEEQREEMAAKQAILALRITSAKLNHVFQKVNGSLSQDGMPHDGKIRRQIL
jgi:hypothetical protein